MSKKITAYMCREDLAAIKRAADASGLTISEVFARAARRELVRLTITPADLMQMQMKSLALLGVTAGDLKAAAKSPTTISAEQLRAYIEKGDGALFSTRGLHERLSKAVRAQQTEKRK